MAWPLTPFRTMADGSTFWDALLGNALQTGTNGIIAGTYSLAGAVLDAVGGTALAARTATSALLRAVNPGGKQRASVDYLGFRSGWVGERVYMPWDIRRGSNNTDYNGWITTKTTNTFAGGYGQLEGGTLTTIMPGGALVLQNNASRTASDSVYIVSPGFYNSLSDATLDTGGFYNATGWAIECVLQLGGTMAASDYFIGWASTAGGTAPWASGVGTLGGAASTTLRAGLRFKQSSGDTTLVLESCDGTTATIVNLSTPVTPALKTPYRVRLELHRSGSSFGAGIRCFVNGVLTTKTTNLPITASGVGVDMSWQYINISSGTGALSALEVGPTRVNYNLGALGATTAGTTGPFDV